MSQIRWPAVLSGFVVAALLGVMLGRAASVLAGVENPGDTGYARVRRAPGGWLSGRAAGGQFGVMQGVAVAVLFILVAASYKAWVEISMVSRFGPQVLGPMDMGGLILGDLIHLTGACLGGWLADVQRTMPARPRV